MNTVWATSLLVNTACLIYLWRKRVQCSVVVCQVFSCASGFVLLFLYFWRGCSQNVYELTAWAVEVLCTVFELWVLYRLMLHRRSSARIIAAFAIVLHQSTKLQWFWAALPFQYPEESPPLLTYMRVATNFFVMAAFCNLAYDAQMKQKPEVQPTKPVVEPQPNDTLAPITKPTPQPNPK